jgi:hypothetical protein
MTTTAAARYKELATKRDNVVRRSREYASLTIPSLLPPEGQTEHQQLPDTYQSFGARAVNHLSSKLMTALLPPGVKFFKMDLPAEVKTKAAGALPADLETNLSKTEDLIHAEINRRGWRKPTFQALQHLIVTGNALEQMMPDNRIRVFRIDQYVVVRNPNGDPIEIVVEEFYSPNSLDEDLLELVDVASRTPTQNIALYTWAKFDGRKGVWTVHQEITDKTVPGSEGEYKTLPLNPLRWIAVVGEDYGRGMVEDHYGDLRSLEGFSRSSIEGAAMASRNLTMIRPNAAGGLNLRRRMAKARNGELIVGNPEDVQMLQFTNVAGLQIVAQERAEVLKQLAAAFLMTSAVTRDAERVTAYEIKKVIDELEGVLGGVFSFLAADLQLARVGRLVSQMQSNDQLPQWPEGLVEPTILTGLEALGRERDVERVATAIQFVQGLGEQAQDYVKWPVLLNKGMNGLGLSDAVRSEEEVAQIQQQRAMAEAMARAQMDPSMAGAAQPEGTA